MISPRAAVHRTHVVPAAIMAAAIIGILLLSARLATSFPADERIIVWMQSLQSGPLTILMQSVSWLGRPWVLFPVLSVTAAVLAARRKQECYMTLGVIGLVTLGPVLKAVADRARPPGELFDLAGSFTGNGFPSGHSYQSFLVFGVLIYLTRILVPWPRLRLAVQGGLALLILTIGISRIYLGAHWPSDVIGAYVIGGSLLLLLIGWHRRTAARSVTARP